MTVRTVFETKILLLVLAACVGSGLTLNCSRGETVPSSTTIGSVGLAFRVSSTTNLDIVDYLISGNGITPIAGTISVAQSAATISARVGGIPAASGYRAELRGMSPDGQTTCQGSSTFGVQTGQTTSIIVLMLCRGPADTGSVGVGGGVDNCPSLSSVSVSPVSVPLGDIINVDAIATDPDVGDTLTFAWTATGGSFARATSAQTTFTCSASGSQNLTVVVSDGSCIDSVVIGVTCVPPRCGNGLIEPGEQCDPPASSSCSATCQRLAICGNGVVEQTEQCDPPNGTTCDMMCRTISAGGTAGGGSGGGGGGATGAGGNAGGGGGSAGTGGSDGGQMQADAGGAPDGSSDGTTTTDGTD
jgi:hypothetical protein